MRVRAAVVGGWVLAAGPAAGQVTETGHLFGSDSVAGDIFAYAIASGGTAVAVAAPFAHMPSDDEGAVYLFERVGGQWVQVQKAFASNRVPDLNLGTRLGMDGTTMVASGAALGTAYVFERGPGGWPQAETQRLTTPASGAANRFGSAPIVAGDRIFVSAPLEPVGAAFGAVYLFERQGGGWMETARMTAGVVPFPQWQIGLEKSADGDRLLVGGQNSRPQGLSQAGAAYVFDRQAGVWTHTAVLVPQASEADQWFGSAVLVKGDVALIGAAKEDSAGANAGALYEFRLIGGSWVQTSRFVPPGLAAGSYFGITLAEWQGCILVGAYLEPLRGSASGAVYALRKTAAGWDVLGHFAGSAVDGGDLFGWSMGAAGGVLAVAAPFDGTLGLQAGSAYVFDLECGSAPCYANCDGSTGSPVLNVNDFVCFQTRFAAVEPYADCDHSGGLNVNDFVCFQQAFAAGCR